MIKSVSPYSGKILAVYSYANPAEIEQQLERLENHQKIWSQISLLERAQVLKALGQALLKSEHSLALSISLEMGKPIKQALAEVQKCALCCSHYAELANAQGETLLLDPKLQGAKFQVYKQAQGVVLAIMPWNFPLWQVFRFLVPSLLMGNGILIKPADSVVGTTLLLADILKNIFTGDFNPTSVLALTHEQVSKCIQDPRIAAVTFTGSVRGGRQVAELCGRNLKKHVLELGGSDAYIVLEDADVKAAAQICCESRLQNAGQSCVAAKRFFVSQKNSAEFLHEYSVKAESFRKGDPTEESTTLGPLAHSKFAESLALQKENLQKLFPEMKPLSLPIQGEANFPNPSAFVSPEILNFGNLESSSNKLFASPWTEEIFAPVACFWSFKEEALAVTASNNSIFGLGGAIFTRDLEKASRLAKELQCGLVAVNDMVKSDPKWPFGGIKQSGYGKELGFEGLQEFINAKSILNLASKQ
jgi:succinate-semialdehyde dehydrogenase/glutarate-semialdehyde dehydrogenase